MKKLAKPKLIVHNSVSLDGSLLHFTPNMELHYRIAGSYTPNAHLIGSNTIRQGIVMYSGEVPEENEKDMKKPSREIKFPYWFIPDTKGSLIGLLHVCRRFEYCRDIIILVSESTPREYLRYLKKRNYDFHTVGRKRVDLQRAFDLMMANYGVKTVLADTGQVLGNILINQGFADMISLLVHPQFEGKKCYPMFRYVNPSIRLKLVKHEPYEKKYLWLEYEVEK